MAGRAVVAAGAAVGAAVAAGGVLVAAGGAVVAGGAEVPPEPVRCRYARCRHALEQYRAGLPERARDAVCAVRAAPQTSHCSPAAGIHHLLFVAVGVCASARPFVYL